MEVLLTLNALFLLSAIPVVGIIYMIFKFRYKVQNWNWTDLLVLVIPGNIYAILDLIRLDKYIGNYKTLANLVEPLFIGISCGAIFLVRVALGKKYPYASRKLSLLAILLMVILTIGVYVFTPSLPE